MCQAVKILFNYFGKTFADVISYSTCMLQHNIYLEDAQKGLYEIKKARNACLNNDFYKDRDINNNE